MIAGCIEKMRAGDCGDCERRDACASLLALLSRRRPLAAGRPTREPAGKTPFLAFVGMIAKAMEARPKVRPGPTCRAVEALVEPLLGEGPVRVGEVARQMGLSRQTLYRRLKEEGATFEAVVDGLRRRLALGLVGQKGLAVKEAAYRLGFADPAAFSRAFKRWTGLSPRAYRGAPASG
ncbi:MAG: helix-turn-helix transcriptional regulator [Alphaproteobacteria bacterium]|nr:helix-turn-helix transcriptional regulator [Alphaproteobacteria bacterium]MBV9372478.1 helix-turn-helix transcriptional regulator [Alphaproteobacteria bacterium]MBV9902153.1 helix-turn-helix transcriptional regulator [Alphaproteobacteria bacterium]